MTVNSEVSRQRYAGNGITTQFSTVFAFLANSHVKVIGTAANGDETVLSENLHYTLSGANIGTAGTVTTLAPVPTGTFLTIMRDVPFTQPFDGEVLSNANAQDLETSYDKIWHALGQLREVDDRTLKSSPGGAGEMPTTWTALLAVRVDGTRNVLQIVGWTGGEGPEPASGQYIGPEGFVLTIAEGADIRGLIGPVGPIGPIGPIGPVGPQGPIGPSGPGTGDMLRSANLSDLVNATTARTNLGLGAAATRNIGFTSTTVPQGDLVAPLASPNLTGTPVAPTAAAATNTTQIATTAFVQTAIADLPTGSIDFDELNSTAIATIAEVRAGTANKLLTGSVVWAAANPFTLTDAPSVAPDFSAGFDFIWMLTAAGRTLANPTNIKAGQKGIIQLKQDAGGGKTITGWGSAYKFPNGGKPTLTGGANAIDVISYAVIATDYIACAFLQDVK